MAVLNEVAKIHLFIEVLLGFSSSNSLVFCLLFSATRLHKVSAQHLQQLFVHLALQQASFLPSEVSTVLDCCLTEPQTGTLDTVH